MLKRVGVAAVGHHHSGPGTQHGIPGGVNIDLAAIAILINKTEKQKGEKKPNPNLLLIFKDQNRLLSIIPLSKSPVQQTLDDDESEKLPVNLFISEIIRPFITT